MPIISSIINASAAANQAAEQRAWEEEKMALENQYQLDMWNKQNEYNSPQAQMQRFQDAGLSPQLIYGQGSPGNATAAPELHAPDLNYRTFPGVNLNPLNTIKDMLVVKNLVETVKQNQLETWFKDINLLDTANQFLGKRFAGGETKPFYFGKKSIFHPFPPFEVSGLSDYYTNNYAAALKKSSGQGEKWQFVGNLAKRGLSEKDHFLWRFFTQNAPKSMDTIFKDILSVDQILSQGLNGLGTFLGL